MVVEVVGFSLTTTTYTPGPGPDHNLARPAWDPYTSYSELPTSCSETQSELLKVLCKLLVILYEAD